MGRRNWYFRCSPMFYLLANASMLVITSKGFPDGEVITPWTEHESMSHE